MFRMSFLKIAAPDFMAWNLSGDGEDGNTATVTIVEPVDQMEITRAATSGTDCQLSREMRFRASGKRRGLFMSHVNPAKLLSPSNRVGNTVERIAGNTVNLPNSRFSENIHQQVRYVFIRHGGHPLRKEEEFTFSLTCGFRFRLHHRRHQHGPSSNGSANRRHHRSPSSSSMFDRVRNGYPRLL